MTTKIDKRGFSVGSRRALNAKRLQSTIQKIKSEENPSERLLLMVKANDFADDSAVDKPYKEDDFKKVRNEIFILRKNMYEAKRQANSPPVKQTADEPASDAPAPSADSKPEEVKPKKSRSAGRKKPIGNVGEVIEGTADKARVLVSREELTKKIIDDYDNRLKETMEKVNELRDIIRKYTS